MEVRRGLACLLVDPSPTRTSQPPPSVQPSGSSL